MDVRFAIVSDLHIALPETIENGDKRFHLTQFSIPALEVVIQHLNSLNIDFLLLPGDLTQDGERVNHRWLSQRLKKLAYPVYVIPGNHDLPSKEGNETVIGFSEFVEYYRDFGYENATATLDYTCEVAKGVYLVGLNSTHFDNNGNQLGRLLESQFVWLEETLSKLRGNLVFVMLHHNVLEHLPQQSTHVLGKRYMLENAPLLLCLLRKYGVRFVFTGHLHIQDIAEDTGIYDITTGSLITYPHPYRILQLTDDRLKINSYKITHLPGMENFASYTQKWMSERSFSFIMTILTSSPLNLPVEEAKEYAPILKNFWTDIADGDKQFDFPQLPPHLNRYFKQFGAIDSQGKPLCWDNNTTLFL
ncbi:MAG: metallophosphoesterase [Geminocystis sp.]|nr:metallophosphoesterase [Geminocystis sp.]HIK36454.1 metallophosphoesterase [Geminocystis sp. M7585_C2015_104]MCS7148994.1 metallophosphoesterase [Geminocystis sp.]MCX8077366.1 metallophosphoesterase [Geminocystis sp.]MDW8114811.1 metallophosphoesterase [Geminocystis sp.]